MTIDRKNITRMDYARTHGWWVRIYRGAGQQKKLVSASFSDSLHGGKRKALAAAVAWRDRTLKKLAPPLRGGGTTPLGHGYVRRVGIVQRSGKTYPHYEAWVRIGPRRWASTKRSVARWGATDAKRLCEAWLVERRRALGVGRVGLVEASVGLRVRVTPRSSEGARARAERTPERKLPTRKKRARKRKARAQRRRRPPR